VPAVDNSPLKKKINKKTIKKYGGGACLVPSAVEASDKAVLHLEEAVVACYDGCCHHAPHLAYAGITAVVKRY
jgi:hypothetical protein